ncbi:hypothetical protein SD37_09415 [Amycolatopsis orientalis]|uniref:Tryptophan synthase beta chain-like PALP domain-containing protein n=1 Tax=Amycolatopsis orientalis TaxID=31958 RepID=A0A193CB11_AMYOR|nr:hypothetical protein SD37_09415 [Amycolatopsis orientalis]
MRATREALDSMVERFPLLDARLEDRVLRLQPESLQPFGSFKVRAALTAVDWAVQSGATRIVTASAGNFAQGLTFAARRAGLPVDVHVPDSAAAGKIAALRGLEARVISHPFDEWWTIMCNRDTGDNGATFVHPVAEHSVLLGNATIGLDIQTAWSEVEIVIVPFGGGGLCVGVAAALEALGSRAEVVTSEVAGSAALSAALAAGHPVEIQRRPSFVDGIGSTRVLDEMWPLISSCITRSIVVSVDEAAAAVRELALRHKLVVEGAGATAFAAACRPEFAGRRVAAVLSGSNIDAPTLAGILSG